MNASSVKVELDEGVHNPNSQFVMLGSGTSNTSPEITCTCACLPPIAAAGPQLSAWLPDALQG